MVLFFLLQFIKNILVKGVHVVRLDLIVFFYDKLVDFQSRDLLRSGVSLVGGLQRSLEIVL